MRPEARAKMGFYPAAEAAVDMMSKRLTLHKNAVILDPCAGDGSAVKRLAENAGLPLKQVVACELDQGRSERLRENLPGAKVLSGADFTAARFSGGPSLYYVNPPYDDEMGGGGRIEERFLSYVADRMKLDSILVFVAPDRMIDNRRFAKILWSYFDDIRFEPFPEGSRPFKEQVIYARKARYNDRWKAIYPCGEGDLKYRVPPGIIPAIFEKGAYTDDELIDACNQSKASRFFASVGRNEMSARPPLNLGRGHLALLLASGHLDGVIQKKGELPHVVRGTASKEEFTKSKEVAYGETSKTTKIVRSERITLTVRRVWQDGAIQTISDSIAERETEEDEVAHAG